MPTGTNSPLTHYQARVLETLRELEIPESCATARRQSLHLEGTDLVSIGIDGLGREQRLDRPAAVAWQSMREVAARDGVELTMVSAFRSFDAQRQIIARKLAAGQALEQILSVSALPGFSEHHTGRAIDIGTTGCVPLTEAFEQTAAFRWMVRQGEAFGFRLSYPRGNAHGIVFEPWHWMFTANAPG